MPTTLISRDRLAQLVTFAADVRIAVIGDAMLDVYLRGEAERISPEAPVPVVRVRDRQNALGGAANVATNVAALGAQVDLVAALGNDPAGDYLRSALVALGVNDASLVSVARPTTTKTRIIARAQQLLRFDEEVDTDLTGDEEAALLRQMEVAINAADAVIFQDYNKGVLTPAIINAAMRIARAHDVPIVVDPKFRNFFAFTGATIFKPNRRELESALGAAVDLEHVDGLESAFRRLECEHLLLTLGERGMTLLSASGESLRVPTTAREVYDVVGAGDTVTAYLATMLARGATAQEASVIANFAAGVEVAKLGAQVAHPHEVLEAYDAWPT